jgi:glycosyltransferase involved in cell wall biosynthesis
MSHQTNPQILSIIIPAYNEATTIRLILDKILAVKLIRNIQREIVIVDDCSTDNTQDIVKDCITRYVTERIVPVPLKEGKKIRWTDGLEAIWTLIKYRFKN